MVEKDNWRYNIPKMFKFLTWKRLRIAFHHSGIPRFVFCYVYRMSHASQKPDFHDSLLFSSVGSRIVWNLPKKLCLNLGINNSQSKTFTIMWVCYFIKPVYLFKSRDKESNLEKILFTCIVKIDSFSERIHVSAFVMINQSIVANIATIYIIILHTSIERVG